MARVREELLPWDAQPQEAVGVAQEIFGARTIDGFVGDARLTHTGQSITLYGAAKSGVFAGGLGINGGADSGFSFPCDLSAHNGITIVFQYVQHSRSGAQVLFEHSPNQNTNAGTFILYTDATAGTLVYGNRGSSAVYDSRSVSAPAVGALVTVALRLRFTASVVSSDDVAIWVNGESPASTNIATTSATNNFGNYSTYFLGRGGTTLRAHATIGLYRVLAGFLSDAACAEVSRNPWPLLFAPRSIWVPVSAGGGANGNASTTPAASTLTAPTATGSGSAQASAAPAGSTLTAPTGTASSAGHASASGALAGLTMAAPTATATGSAQAFAAFITAVLTAPTGTASNGEAPESGHSSAGYGGGGGSGHIGARERLRSRKALADLFEDIKLVKPKEKAPELTEHQEQTIQHALEVVREAQEAVRQTLEKLAEASPLPAQLKVLQAKLRQLEADLEEEEAAVVSLLLL